MTQCTNRSNCINTFAALAMGLIENLGISVDKDTKLLLVYYLTILSGTETLESSIQGWASAGINIL